MADLKYVEADLNYLAESGQKPAVYMYAPPPGMPRQTGRYEQHRMRIYDGRAVAPTLTLDQAGFVLVHTTAVTNFYDAAQVKNVYYGEIERLIKEITGAARVVVFDHNLRSAAVTGVRNEQGVETPVRSAHNDYTLKSGPQRVRDLLPADEAAAMLKSRFAIINAWRPIKGPVQDVPLAVCDARSIAMRDLVGVDMRYRERTGETYSLAFNPNHRWFYIPQMQKEEVLLLKGYDSMEDGRARFTAHTAFDDPTAPLNAAPRESIEARALVFFRDLA